MKPGLPAPPDYLTLDQALASGFLKISEVSAGGSVPNLRAENLGARSVLLLDGEELVGAKQNRVLNLTLLLAANSTTTIPVSCVEAGRWSSRSAEFASAQRMHFAAGRAKRQEHVTESLNLRGDRRSRQGEVWEEIAAKSSELSAPSATGAMADIYQKHQHTVDEYTSAFSVSSEQVGAVFAVGGDVLGCEVFEHPDVLQRVFPKLLGSYALEAVGKAAGGEPAEGAARIFLESVAAANYREFPALGLGRDMRISGDSITGGGLLLDERFVHMAAFRQAGSTARRTAGATGMARPSQRARRPASDR